MQSSLNSLRGPTAELRAEGRSGHHTSQMAACCSRWMPRVKAGGLTPALWPPDTLRNASKQPRHMPRAKWAVPFPCPVRSQASEHEARGEQCWVCDAQMGWPVKCSPETYECGGRLGAGFQRTDVVAGCAAIKQLLSGNCAHVQRLRLCGLQLRAKPE